jgi:two-component sensor histidine kinase
MGENIIVSSDHQNENATVNEARTKQALGREEVLLKAGALQNAIFNSANFSSIATDEKGVIQIFNVGAERMLGYTASDVMNKITPAEISDPQEVIARAQALSQELGTTIAPGFDALVFKASRGIEDVYELTCVRKDGSHFPAVVSVTALRDGQGGIIGYLLIGTDNTARKRAEEALLKAGALQNAIFSSAHFSCIATDEKGVIQLFNVGAERMLGYTASDVMNKITPAEISDPQEVIARAEALSQELGTTIAPGFDALVFKASRGIEDIYELTKIRKDGSRFPAIVSVTALRDGQGRIIGYLLIGTDNTARKQVEAEQKELDQRLRDQQAYTRSLIDSALAEKEVLLREIHHRVKNNMQVISSLLQLQCAYLHDAEDVKIFQECQMRIRSMALVHERLYRSSSLATINFAEYLEDLSVLIAHSQSNLDTTVELVKDYDSVELGLDAAIPLGLVANELISNAFEHAFPGRKKGILTLRLKKTGEESLLFSVSDDGVGLPADFEAYKKKSLGLRLIENLTRQLRATLSFREEANGGSRIELVLPLHL